MVSVPVGGVPGAALPVVVVLAAQGAVPAAVRDVLRDWVALGLLQPLVWVEAGEISPGAPLSEIVGTHLLADHAPRVRLQDHLANQRSIDVLRLVALGSLGEQAALVAPVLAGDVNTALNAIVPGRVVALQCVLTRQGAGGWDPDVSIPGWRTLVLAPEDSWSPSPTQPSTEFAVGGDDAEFTAHAAAGLACLAALWTGMGRGAFDEPGGQSGEPMVVRAFLRRLDTGAVSSRLRLALTDVVGGLPLPQASQGRVEALQDPAQGVGQVYDAVVGQHPELFEVRWIQAERVATRQIGARQAIGLFVAFLVSAVKGAPAAFLERVMDRGATKISAKVQAALFAGQDSRYEVITRGVNAAGLPPGVRDLGLAADDVRDRLAPVIPTEGRDHDLSPFWADVAAGAMSLADAGDHGSVVGPVQILGKARVVRSSSQIAPAPADAFTVGPAVATRLGTGVISPYDVRGQEQAAEVLAALPGGDPVGQDFQAWRRQAGSSFTGLLGARLAAEVRQRSGWLAELIERLREDRSQVDEQEVGRGLHRVRSILLRTLLAVLVIALLAVAGVQLSHLDARLVIAVVSALLVGLLVVQLLALLAQQRHVFAILNAQTKAENALDLASRNLSVAAAALHLSTTMYQQYLAWSPVFGRFLREPFGPVVEPAPVVRLDGLLPRAVGFGVAEIDPEQLAVVAHQLGSTVFDRGWLQPLWEALLADAPRQLGAAGLPLRDDPRLLLADPARTEDSLLRRWSAIVAADGVAGVAGAELWRRARADLVRRGARQLTETLLTTVEVQAQQQHGISGPLSGREFFTALTDALGDVDRHYFAPQLFSDLAATQDRHRVTSTVALGRPEVASLGVAGSSARVRWIEPSDDALPTLDQFLVVVQSSAPVPAGELSLRGPGKPSDPTDADPTDADPTDADPTDAGQADGWLVARPSQSSEPSGLSQSSGPAESSGPSQSSGPPEASGPHEASGPEDDGSLV